MRYWILIGVLLVAACGSSQSSIEDQGVEERMRTVAQYIAATDLRSAANGIFPQGYTLEELPRQPLNCSNGGTLYNVAFIVHSTDPNKNDVYFDLMLEYWSFSGWDLKNNNRPDAMFMNATKGDYLMSIRTGIYGQVVIGTSTPCI